jgi:hypothetical protein
MLDYKHEACKFNSGKLMQLDVFIPTLSLAFEYQGGQHYHHSQIYGSPVKQQMRDNEKKEACNLAGISLICIPYWWNEKIESVAATIQVQRPDIRFATVPNSLPIPDRFSITKSKQAKQGNFNYTQEALTQV